MLTVQAVTTIACTPDELLEFVMDVERYATVDSKIRPIRWVRREGDVTEFGFRPRFLGLPGPTTVSRMRLTPGQRIDVVLPGRPHNRTTRLLSDFDASFVCTPVEGGTHLVRTLNYRFRAPLKWVVEPALRGYLAADVRNEVALAKDHLEQRG